MPIIIRLDGVAFHTLTKAFKRPFSKSFFELMQETMSYLCTKIPNVVLGYTQSDEISLFIFYHRRFESEPWFDNRQSKIESVSAGMASCCFGFCYSMINETLDRVVKPAFFDSRAFVLPEVEVPNYFIWRWKDWVRNSVQMLAQSHFSPKQLLCKRIPDIHEMLHDKGINWATDCDQVEKNGSICYRNSSRVFNIEPAPDDTEKWRLLIDNITKNVKTEEAE